MILSIQVFLFLHICGLFDNEIEEKFLIANNHISNKRNLQHWGLSSLPSWSALRFHGDCGTNEFTNVWTERISGVTSELHKVIYAGGLFVACGSDGTVTTSSDGITWTKRNLTDVENGNIETVVYGNGKYVLVTNDNNSNSRIYSSFDTISWVSTQVSFQAYSMVYGNGLFVGGGPWTTFYSSDGLSWRYKNPVEMRLDIIYADGQFVACGYDGLVQTSVDGKAWFNRTSGTSCRLNAIAYGGVHLIVGYDGTILSSPDGITWTNRLCGTNLTLWGVTYGTGGFIAANKDGVMYGSADGASWAQLSSSPPSILLGKTTMSNHLAFGGGMYVVVGVDGVIYSAAVGCMCNTTSSTQCNETEGCYWNFDSGSCTNSSDLCSANSCRSCSSLLCNVTDGCYWDSGYCQSTSLPSCGRSSCSSCVLSTECAAKAGCTYSGNCIASMECDRTACTTCLNSEACTSKGSPCYWYGSLCVNLTSFCSGTVCSTCNSQESCTDLSASCSYNGSACYNSTSCSVPYVHNDNTGDSFQIYLNGIKTSYRGYTTILVENETDWTGDLQPGVPRRAGGVITTLRVFNENCTTVVAEWMVENTRSSTAPVKIYINAHTVVDNNDFIDWASLPDKHGLYASSFPFYIQAEESFNGTWAGHYSDYPSYLTSSSVDVTTGDGICVNWHNISIAGNATKVFRMEFATYHASYAYGTCSGEACSSCTDPLSCAAFASECAWNGSACYNTITQCGGETCYTCSTSSACMGNDLSLCVWSQSLCLYSSNYCSGTTCSTCNSRNSCTNLNASCFYDTTCHDKTSDDGHGGWDRRLFMSTVMGSVGVVVITVVIITLCCCCWFRKKRKNKSDDPSVVEHLSSSMFGSSAHGYYTSVSPSAASSPLSFPPPSVELATGSSSTSFHAPHDSNGSSYNNAPSYQSHQPPSVSLTNDKFNGINNDGGV